MEDKDKKNGKKIQFDKLSLDDEDKTIIMAGHSKYSLKQMEDEMIDPKSIIGKKLREIEPELEKY